MLVPIAAAAFASPADGSAARATCVAAAFLAGFGLFPAVFAWGVRGAWILGIAVVAATCGAVVARRARRRRDGRRRLRGDMGADLVRVARRTREPAARARLARDRGRRVARDRRGRVRRAALAGSERGSVPEPLLVFNPVVRILWHGLGFDWLRSANMYPRIGTVFYSYPERSEGILASLVAGGAGAVAALLLSMVRRRPAAQR